MEEEKKKHEHPGQPTAFREIYIEQAYKLTLLGATDKELADFFNVTETTINNWKHYVPEFFESIKKGKDQADAEIAEKLYQRAKGYSHPEEKIFCHEGQIVRANTIKHYPPEVAAIAFWLKNRRRKKGLKWQDSHDITSDGEKITPVCIDFADAIKQSEQPSQPESEHSQAKNVSTE